MAQTQWQPTGEWKIIPLGKGFFMKVRLNDENKENFEQLRRPNRRGNNKNNKRNVGDKQVDLQDEDELQNSNTASTNEVCQQGKEGAIEEASNEEVNVMKETQSCWVAATNAVMVTPCSIFPEVNIVKEFQPTQILMRPASNLQTSNNFEVLVFEDNVQLESRVLMEPEEVLPK
ncbi:hypothetical protein FRX31_033453 [Thalictrum thalictroides]|uniref:Uncharacterized protein n=1 Tax=Thalictrum thalictroides TaxID=46969 RepID=A0A7J6UXP5_THATH|nr:hypothetical protein FRX31_033453 [Thalictrum thalictroides]